MREAINRTPRFADSLIHHPARVINDMIFKLPVAALSSAAILFLAFNGSDMAQAQSTQRAAQPLRWAIAIHGGAGGNPSKWDEAKRKAREDGLRDALQIGKQRLAGGGSALDAVEDVIRSLEDNASFNAGRGAVVTTDGKAELDASLMDGRNRACGAVAGVTRIKNPISAARRVMSKTKHVLLIGQGADAFAEAEGLPMVQSDYFLSWQQSRKTRDPDSAHLGTVGCVALDSEGNLAAGTSTGGTTKKLPGRVGDSPIVGAGTFADNQTCAVSGTGIGEEYIRNAVAYDVSAQMNYAKRTIKQAITTIMTERLKKGEGGLIGLSRDGTIVMQHNTPAMSCGAADSQGRFEVHLQLPGGGRQ